MAKLHFNLKSCGATRIGERGQVVIPKEARNALKLKSGDQLFSFVRDDEAVVLIRSDRFEGIVQNMMEQIKSFTKVKKQ